MSMLQLNGTVFNVLEAPKGTNRKTGEEFGGYHQVQLICEEPLRNGHKRAALFTLATDDPSYFQKRLNQPVSVPVGFYVRGGNLHFYLHKAAPAAPEAAK